MEWDRCTDLTRLVLSYYDRYVSILRANYWLILETMGKDISFVAQIEEITDPKFYHSAMFC